MSAVSLQAAIMQGCSNSNTALLFCLSLLKTWFSLLACLLTAQNTPPDSPPELWEIYFASSRAFPDQVRDCIRKLGGYMLWPWNPFCQVLKSLPRFSVCRLLLFCKRSLFDGFLSPYLLSFTLIASMLCFKKQLEETFGREIYHGVTSEAWSNLLHVW